MRKIYSLIVLSLFGLQAFSQSGLPAYCLENETVHRYLTEVQYDPTNYNYSLIRNYCYDMPWDWQGEGNGVRLDKPAPVGLKLTNALVTDALLYVSENEEFTDSVVVAVAAGVDSVNVWNLIPGRTYNWKLEYDNAGVKTVAESGRFQTTGTLRMLNIDGIYNVRDMGGWEGLGGHKIRYGAIIRGSRLNVNNSSTKIITPAGIAELRRIGVTAELDMRNKSNAANATSSFLGSDIPIYNVENAYNSRIATFGDAPQSIEGMQQLIKWLKEGRTVYMHCSVGADRTGTVAFLVGALCGMSEDALCKEFELTSFSGDWIENERDPGNPERLIRQRDYTGRLDPNDNNNSYKFASMIDKVKSFPGETMQQKVYYHLSTGAKPNNGGTLARSIPASDLDWLIKYLVDYTCVKDITTIDYDLILEMEYGQSVNLNAQVTPANATETTLTYVSADTNIVKVSADGTVTAVGRGDTKVSVMAGNFVKVVPVSIPLKEATLPATVKFGEETFNVKAETSKIKDGSFEYMTLTNWKNAAGTALSKDNFELKAYPQAADGVYLESKADGDATSNASLRGEWTITKGRTYVFGYRVKNSTDKVTTENENLKVFMIKNTLGDNDASAVVLGKPSYDGNWKEVQYVFTAQANRLRILFTHLSQDGNNTCFDNFYLAELDVPSGTNAVEPIIEPAKPADDRIFNLSGQEVVNPGKGVCIRNGKKYIIK